MDQPDQKHDPSLPPDPEVQAQAPDGQQRPEAPNHDRPWDDDQDEGAPDEATFSEADSAANAPDEEDSQEGFLGDQPPSDPDLSQDPAVLQTRLEAQALALRAAEARLAEALKRQDEMVAAYRKMQAEFEASRQRLDRERAERLERERCGLLERLFEPLDNLERSIAAASASTCDPRLLEGLQLVLRQFQGSLTELGLERLDPKGQEFSPEFHEALSVMPVQDPSQDNLVLEVWQVGYKVGQRLLRPARVLIGRK